MKRLVWLLPLMILGCGSVGSVDADPGEDSGTGHEQSDSGVPGRNGSTDADPGPVRDSGVVGSSDSSGGDPQDSDPQEVSTNDGSGSDGSSSASDSSSGSNLDSGSANSDASLPNDGGVVTDSGTVVVDSGTVVADSGAVVDSGSPDPCANVTCPAGEVCQNGNCVCDGPPPPPKDSGSVCNAQTDCEEDGKTLLCHIPPGNPSNEHNICVGNAAVPAHLAHGDSLGCCPQ